MRKKTILLLIVILTLIVAPVAFFYFTTRMAAPEPLTIVASETETVNVNSKRQIILWLLAGDQVYTYEDDDHKSGRKLNYNELRSFLINKKQQFKDELSVVIKKSERASYKNTVDALDEMTINNVKDYTLTELSKEEEKLVGNLNQHN